MNARHVLVLLLLGLLAAIFHLRSDIHRLRSTPGTLAVPEGAGPVRQGDLVRHEIVDLIDRLPWQPPPGQEGARIDLASLKPRHLDEGEEMARFLEAFPHRLYEISEVPGLGRFYLDDANDLIKFHLARGRVWEPVVVEILHRVGRPGTVMIDVGAHVGSHTLTMARIAGPEGRVIAFEPQRKLFRELVHNLRINGMTNAIPLRYAVGDRPGLIEMDPPLAGNEGGTGVGAGGDPAELRTLDSFGLRDVSLLKIDVEGFERHVIEGARRTILTNRPRIILEISGGEADFDLATPELRKEIVATIRAVEDFGYHVVRLTRSDFLGLPLSRREPPTESATARDTPSP